MKKFWLTAVVFALAACFICFCGGSLTDTPPKEFTFITISDVHIPSYGSPIGQPLDEETLMGMHNQKRIRQFVEECLAMDTKPDFIINTGDTGDMGWIPLLELYQKLMRPLVDAGIPVYTAVGNHDLDYAGIGAEDLSEFFDPLGPALIGRSGTRYSFDYEGCHFVFVNNRPISGLIRLNPEELEWLRDDLKSVEKDTPVLLFLHANMQVDDTHRVVEILQQFRCPAIFQGHRHSVGIGAWGGVPVVLTGSLYGGTPEAGSFRIVTVKPDTIVVRTRDFAKPAGTLEPEEIVEYPQPGPEMRVIGIENEGFVSGTVTLAVETDPPSPGTVEYRIPGFNEWTSIQGKNGRWEVEAPMPADPGRHFLAFRFTGDDGSVVLAHRIVKTPGKNVGELWARDLGSAVQGAPVICGDLAILPTIEGGVYALRLDDGTEAWHKEADGGQILGRVVTDGESVYYGTGRIVCACDAETGKLLWQTQLDGTIIAGLTYGSGRLFVPAGERKLYCLDTGEGTILWDYTVRLPVIMEPETDGNRVYFGAMDGRLRALNAETGAETWNIQWSSLEDCCVDAGTGDIRWTYRTNTGPQGSLYGPCASAVKDNLAIVGTMDGQVFALEW